MSRLNPISTFWFWRGLSGHSVTFATLFASVLLGFSFSSGLHHLLRGLGFHWIYVLLLPILLFNLLAQAEVHLIPDPVKRRTLALGILGISIALSLAISRAHSREDANPVKSGRGSFASATLNRA